MILNSTILLDVPSLGELLAVLLFMEAGYSPDSASVPLCCSSLMDLISLVPFKVTAVFLPHQHLSVQHFLPYSLSCNLFILILCISLVYSFYRRYHCVLYICICLSQKGIYWKKKRGLKDKSCWNQVGDKDAKKTQEKCFKKKIKVFLISLRISLQVYFPCLLLRNLFKAICLMATCDSKASVTAYAAVYLPSS